MASRGTADDGTLHAARRAEHRGRQHQVPADQRHAEHAALLALQDRRSVDEQARTATAGRRRSAAATPGRTTSRAPYPNDRRTARSMKTPRAGTSSCRAPTMRRSASASRRWCATRRASTSPRQISVGAGSATAAGAIFSGTVNVEPLEFEPPGQHHRARHSRRSRVQPGPRREACAASFDLFNITNTNAAETRTVTTGSAFCRPTAVLAPRTLRIGFRLTF